MARLDAYLGLPSKDSDQVQSQVRDIISDVEKHGDDALLKYTRKYDGLEVDSAKELVVSDEAIRAAPAQREREVSQALQRSIDRGR